MDLVRPGVRISQLGVPALDHGRRDRRPASWARTPYISKKSNTLVGGVCDCIAVLVVDGKPWEGKAAHEKLDALWEEHGRGQADAANAFRREWDRQVRAGETKQYLPPSVQ